MCNETWRHLGLFISYFFGIFNPDYSRMKYGVRTLVTCDCTDMYVLQIDRA